MRSVNGLAIADDRSDVRVAVIESATICPIQERDH